MAHYYILSTSELCVCVSIFSVSKMQFVNKYSVTKILMFPFLLQEIFHKMSRGSVSMETYSLRTAIRMTGTSICVLHNAT